MMMSAAEMPDSGIRVSLVTLYPGSEVYEVYGHTELRVQDSYGDFFFNYGLFDFNSPGFVYRFVKGETDYLCGASCVCHARLHRATHCGASAQSVGGSGTKGA